MIIYRLPDDGLEFPPAHLAGPDGILAVGGDLSVERLLSAYSQGIFPWYEEELSPILWWSPNPRFTLLPENLHVPHSLRKVLKRNTFSFSVNTDFAAVIRACAASPRPEPYFFQNQGEDDNAGADGYEGEAAGWGGPETEKEPLGRTWLGPAMIQAYLDLHRAGFALSVEARLSGVLVGGFYGVALGCAFFGESMFYHVADASKAAFVWFMGVLKDSGYTLVDCQQNTAHLARFGAKDMPRTEFLQRLRAAISCDNYFS